MKRPAAAIKRPAAAAIKRPAARRSGKSNWAKINNTGKEMKKIKEAQKRFEEM
jgi:hypothetical protein